MRCPTLLTGRAAGLKLGPIFNAPKDAPPCNVWLSMPHGLGGNGERHGDSTVALEEVIA